MTQFPSRVPETARTARTRRAVLGLMALFSAPVALSSPALIAPAFAQSAAVTPINDLYAALGQIQSSGSGTSEARAQIIAPVIDRSFDLSTILHNSVGMRYTTLSADEQSKLLAAFRQFTIARYVSSFKKGGDAKFTISPTTRPAPTGGSTIVNTTIGDGSDSSTAINYVMMPSGGGYRIVDILLNGHISQVAAQRADFSSTLARGGVDALVTLLNHKTAKFMNN